MLIPIYKGEVQGGGGGGGGGGGCAFAEPALLIQKFKVVVQNNMNDLKNPNNSHNHRDEMELYPKISKSNT